MSYSSYVRYREIKQIRENVLRLFEPLHQNDIPNYRRASGLSYCQHSGLSYLEHPNDTESYYFNDAADKRLCNGDIIHL